MKNISYTHLDPRACVGDNLGESVDHLFVRLEITERHKITVKYWILGKIFERKSGYFDKSLLRSPQANLIDVF